VRTWGDAMARDAKTSEIIHDCQRAHLAGWNLQSSYAELPGRFYTEQAASCCEQPKLVVFNAKLAGELGLNAEILGEQSAAPLFAGNLFPEGANPIAQAYAGHQFGNFTILGDGRALLVGEQITPDGRRRDIQLKGSGPTPYSRGGDGRAALGPMLREYLISEAMHGLGIPTTRSLAVVTTGEGVFRERQLPGAVLTRVARSHIRVGTFEFAAALRDQRALIALVDYTIQRRREETGSGILGAPRELTSEMVGEFLTEVCREQGALIAKWLLVGFVHGVMNTDNMSLAGETIDFGPCAFMDKYQSSARFSSIDRQGRYAFAQQPLIGKWNLARLAETLLGLLVADENFSSPERRTARAIELAELALDEFSASFAQDWLAGVSRKLGFSTALPHDGELAADFLQILESQEFDYQWSFRCLADLQGEGRWLSESAALRPWLAGWEEQLKVRGQDQATTNKMICENNPAVIPRNVHVEYALSAAVEDRDLAPFQRLLAAVQDPFTYRASERDLVLPPPVSSVPYRTFCGT
jgi:serine/tyrosine/threonine adenylyltransferase